MYYLLNIIVYHDFHHLQNQPSKPTKLSSSTITTTATTLSCNPNPTQFILHTLGKIIHHSNSHVSWSMCLQRLVKLKQHWSMRVKCNKWRLNLERWVLIFVKCGWVGSCFSGNFWLLVNLYKQTMEKIIFKNLKSLSRIFKKNS